MTVGIGIVGRQVLMTVGGQTILGVQSKGGEHTNTKLDVSDDQANGWVTSLAIAGEKGVAHPISGVLKNLELLKAYYDASQAFEIVFTFPDGSTETGDFYMETFTVTGQYKELFTFDASFTSTGAVTFVAGV